MLEILKQVLISPTGSFGFVMGGAVLVAWFILWAYGKFIKMQSTHEHMHETCARLDGHFASLQVDLASVKGDIRYIKSTLNSLTNLAQRGDTAPLMQAHSPLALTENGRRAAQAMGAGKAIAQNWERISEELNKALGSSQNPYDIQTFCLEQIPIAPSRFLDQATLDALKLYAYQNGLTLFDCLKVVGLMIRDKYLETKGIPLARLDSAAADAAK